MTDVGSGTCPDDVVAALDADASRLGLTRSEYLRRKLAREAVTAAGHRVSVTDLTRFGELFADLGQEEVMRQAWR